MKKLAVILVLTLSLGGCALFQRLESIGSELASSHVSPSAVVIAANTFDALEASATNYLRLKRCSPTTGPICRDPAFTAKIIPVVRSGRVARDNLILFMRAHPGQLAPQGVYDALVASINTAQAIITQYNAGVQR